MPFIGQQPLTGAYSKLDSITTSATATYNLQLDSAAYSPASANHLLVSLNGVMQAPEDSFTVSGSTITFASALTSSDNIDFIMALGDVLNIGTPSDGTVTAAKIASSAVTDAKIASGITASKLTGALPAISGSSLTGMGGKILQIVNTSDGTRRKYTSNSNNTWLGTYNNLNTTITPQSTTSKLLFFVDINWGLDLQTAGSIMWRVVLGSSPVAGLNGDTSQTYPAFSQFRWNFHSADPAEYGTQCARISGGMINSPGTSASLYKFEYRIQDSGRQFSINRDCSDQSDSSQGSHSPTLTSRCTIIEVEL